MVGATSWRSNHFLPCNRRYGAVGGGSTFRFFESSNNEVYQKLYTFMSGVHRDEVIMNGNDEGIEKVIESNGKYAFFMESASIQYLQERNCKISQVVKELCRG